MSEFREMRRKRQQLSEEESISILKKATAGTLALLGDDDYPYAVPISYVYADGRLYFHSALSGHKVDAIRKCDKASFCVIEQDEVHPEKYTTFFRSVIAFGRIHIIEDEGGTHDVDNIAGGYHEKLATARIFGNRYNPNQEEVLQKELESGLSRMLMIRFDIEHLTGKEAIELMKQREQSQACLNSAELRQKKTEGQLVKHKNDNAK
jgi:nitroimidazol reductase NimA-like FMN-containing flavoprotein (pyridoxamine 5'-phosphate oxidase superfamily)